MEKIIFNEKQKNVLRIMLLGLQDVFDYTEEEMVIGKEIFNLLDKLYLEPNAASESGSDPIVWLWSKYLKQEGLYKNDNIRKIVFTKKQKTILEAASKGEYIAALEDKETNDDYFEVICKVCSYIAETNAYKELNDSCSDYLEWFLNIYQKQNK